MTAVLPKAKERFSRKSLTINDNKTQLMTFGLRQVSNDDEEIRFLGFYLEPTLSWQAHLNHAWSRLARVLFILRKLKSYFVYYSSSLSLLWPLPVSPNIWFTYTESFITCIKYLAIAEKGPQNYLQYTS